MELTAVFPNSAITLRTSGSQESNVIDRTFDMCTPRLLSTHHINVDKEIIIDINSQIAQLTLKYK